jgi:oxygen-independent coproporphyrinogen-3 oxidase
MSALAAEIKRHRFAWTPNTVYLGGGTPGSMDVGELAMLLDLVPGRPWSEVTIEAAPGGITAEHARAWVNTGITRVSLGVQSFVQAEIARTGRKHTASVVQAELNLLRNAGLPNINIDLIAGLSGQTEASWRESLEWIERLNPPHVSVYMLEVDEDSRLGREVLLGGVRYGAPETPGEAMTADLYETAVERLEAAGLQRYEISNFARPGWESRHNLKYWMLEPYAGFGADAHSFDGELRSENVETAADYVKSAEPRIETTAAILREERFFVGLRLTAGIRPRPDEWDYYRDPIQRFVADGLLERMGDTLRLTGRGVLLSNEIFQEFLTA